MGLFLARSHYERNGTMRTNSFFLGTKRIGRAAAFAFAAAMICALLLLFGSQATIKPAHAATTFTVDRSDDPELTAASTADECTAADNDCSLRGAITAANNTSGADTINFAIPGSGVKTILVDGKDDSTSTDLPVITEAVTINGYTQTGASENTNTSLAQGTNANLLIELSGAFLTSSNGLMQINASDVVVKGLALKCYNTGIAIQPGGSRAVIEGNFIGTNASGATVPCLSNNGINVFGGGANTFGGKDPADRNLISGNLVHGLNIADNGGNTIQGNLIGTNANGTEGLGNQIGVGIGSPNNIVGGDNADSDNAGEGNRIAFNGSDGVQVRGGRNNPFAVGNRILNNSIFSNGNLGIDLDGSPLTSPNPDADGVTANDRKDRDTGPNTLQNFPRLASATTADSGITTIKGTLNSRPRKTFLIQFFSSETKNSAGFAEGKTWVGQVTKMTNREGKFSFSLDTVLPTGENLVTATATSLDTSTMPATPIDTSEFSNAVTAS
jgi:hypothetical protein